MGDQTARLLASIACGMAAIGFIVGGIGMLASQIGWRPTIVGAAVFSSIVYALFWDGNLHKLDNQGAIAILINIAILVAVLVLRLPDFGS